RIRSPLQMLDWGSRHERPFVSSQNGQSSRMAKSTGANCSAPNSSSTLEYSPRRCEPLLDLLHQRIRQFRRAQFRESLDHDGLPGLLALHVLGPAMRKVDRPRLLDTAEEHERVRTVTVKP